MTTAERWIWCLVAQRRGSRRATNRHVYENPTESTCLWIENHSLKLCHINCILDLNYYYPYWVSGHLIHPQAYIALRTEHYLVGHVRRELAVLVEGFHDVIPRSYLRALNTHDSPLKVQTHPILFCVGFQVHVIRQMPFIQPRSNLCKPTRP